MHSINCFFSRALDQILIDCGWFVGLPRVKNNNFNKLNDPNLESFNLSSFWVQPDYDSITQAINPLLCVWRHELNIQDVRNLIVFEARTWLLDVIPAREMVSVIPRRRWLRAIS